jgi:uncharacterized protein
VKHHRYPELAKVEILSLAQARKLILHGQGLLDSPARKRAPLDLVRQLGYLQLDSINVLERAHHLTLGARWDGYRRAHLKRAFEHDRDLFEGWTHDACLIPMESEPHWRVRRERFQTSSGGNHWWRERMGPNPGRIQNQILKRIESEGPLPTSAFRKKGTKRAAWWGWTPEKSALEYSWRTGLLAVHSRSGFEKIYDLAERVLPSVQKRPTTEETLAWSCREALLRLGVATTRDLAAFWHFFRATELEEWCRSSLTKVMVDGQEYWVRPDYEQVLEAQEEAPKRLRLLCPFDPVVRDRQRLATFFDYHYRFEAFVPKAKRKYGYYALPMLCGGRFVGRLDAKFHRHLGTVEVLGSWWEGRAQPARLEKELVRLTKRIGAEAYFMEGPEPEGLPS